MTAFTHSRHPGQEYAVDFLCTKLPRTDEGYEFALVVICTFTSFTWILPLREKDAISIAEALWDRVFATFGLPRRLHSDNDFILVSDALKILYDRLGIKKTTIYPGHPQGNAQAERMMRYLNAAITVTLPSYHQWNRAIPMVLFAYRTMLHATTGYSPFYLMFGRHPVIPLDLTMGPEEPALPVDTPSTLTTAQGNYIKKTIEQLKIAFRYVRRNRQLASDANAARRDNTRFVSKFEVGDLVLIWEPTSETARRSHTRTGPVKDTRAPAKWRFRWSGPHIVNKKISENAYLIQNQNTGKLDRKHVDRLQHYFPFDPQCQLETEKVVERKTRQPPKPPIQPESVPAGSTAEPAETDVTTTSDMRELKPGDLCIVVIPGIDVYLGTMPLVVARYLDAGENDMHFQWYGSTQPITNEFLKGFPRKRWLAGWLQLRNKLHYWRKGPEHNTHVPFTNYNTGHVIARDDVLMWGIPEPDSKGHLSKKTCDNAIWMYNQR
jgi:hypothetical protein